eukprot:NODE_8_length_66115_cov_0.981823.p47 type:complete len:146 gc:universal NODE_8_length_66115_cov_0.981823:51814-52251(+)
MRFPSVQLLAKKYNIDLSKVKASGFKNSLNKGDILSYIDQNNLLPTFKLTNDHSEYYRISRNRRVSPLEINSFEKSTNSKVKIRYNNYSFADIPLQLQKQNWFSILTSPKNPKYEQPSSVETILMIDSQYKNVAEEVFVEHKIKN